MDLNYICSHQETWLVVCGYYFVDKCFEYWLGKTDKVKSSSMLELLINGILSPIKGVKNGSK